MSADDATASMTRTVEGRDLPTPGTFALDPAHSDVGFSVRHMMIAKVKGRFTSVSGTMQVAEDPAQSSVEVEIEAASVDTRQSDRDTHLRSPDFLDVENYPTLSFKSTNITPLGGDKLGVDGDLTVHGVTRAVSLEATFNGLGQDPWGNQRVGFEAAAEVDREDFGLTWNQALETGGVLVGKQVRIELETEFVRQ